MISYIVRLARDFEVEHGVRANLLYLNQHHFDRMKMEFPDPEVLAGLITRLEMEILVDNEVIHPHLAWMPIACAQGVQ